VTIRHFIVVLLKYFLEPTALTLSLVPKSYGYYIVFREGRKLVDAIRPNDERERFIDENLRRV